MTKCKNNSIYFGTFSGSLKCTSLQKKDPFDKSNYRHISILPLLSIFCDKLLFNQLSEYTNKLLSRILYGFRKAHSTQHAFLTV